MKIIHYYSKLFTSLLRRGRRARGGRAGVGGVEEVPRHLDVERWKDGRLCVVPGANGTHRPGTDRGAGRGSRRES